MNKKSLLIILCVLCSLFCNLLIANATEELKEYTKVKAYVIEEKVTETNQIMLQTIRVRILDGQFKDRIIEFNHRIIEDSKFNIRLHKNMKVFVQLTIENNQLSNIAFIDVVKDEYLLLLSAIFFILLVIFGGFKGLRSFIALIITGLCLVKLFMPMIIKGYSFVFSTIAVSGVIIITSFLLISGFTKKSLCAILGTLGGTIASGLLAIYFGNLIQLTGVSDETVQILITQTNLNINYRGLLYSGITIGVLGAVMDVSMTITSVIFEIKSTNRKTSISKLFFSGLSVGKDIMATMTNTLILAYAGTSLPLLFLFSVGEMTLIDIVNTQYIASEIIRSLCGSIGLLLTIPITSLIAAINSR
ncbi:YibE/F family protein [Alkaliphilus pronyensis]|uniref:YibE/F family protein n=1 Tax=Alkaliphilus pronyensis TaxID=1482732 RepID=A0A6I0FHF8_9FIRM|nr:YibE/F family protein [Alkaliphilus pronyensis]KAB3537838.1 YibE/F family protein [Alkaliphilus pronyensis]